MRFEFFDEMESLGSVAWMGPGQVRFDLRDPERRDEMVRFFAGETVHLTAGFDHLGDGDGVRSQRRDWTPWDFSRACAELAWSRRYAVIARPVGPVEDRAEGGG